MEATVMKLKQQIFYDDDNIRNTAEELLAEYSPGEFSQLWEDFLFALDPEASNGALLQIRADGFDEDRRKQAWNPVTEETADFGEKIIRILLADQPEAKRFYLYHWW